MKSTRLLYWKILVECDSHSEYLLSQCSFGQAHSTHLTAFQPLILCHHGRGGLGLILSLLVSASFDSRMSVI